MAILGEVFSIIRNGASIKQIDGANGFPITRIETISNRVIDRNRLGYANVFDITEYESYVLQSGDILMSHINSEKHLGKTALYIKKGNEKIIHGMNLLMLRANSEVILPLYAKYFFDSNLFLKQIPNITKKSVNQASFTVTALKKLEIKIPQMVEQKRIIDIMSRLDNIIQYRKDQLEKLDLFVKSRFIEMFGDPVYNSMKWNTELLCHLGDLNRGVSKHRPRNDPKLLGGIYPLIQTGDVANSDGYIRSYKTTYSEEGLKQSKMWSSGVLCITIAANIAKTAILTFDACFPDSVVGFEAGSKVTNLYIHYWFTFIQKILEEQAPESAQKNINLRILSELNVMVPPIELQNKFADFVAQVDKSKLAIQQSLDELETLKKSLMQQYFG